MKGFFDTSVLVPVFYGDHIHHKASLELFIQFDKTSGCCGAHSLVEVFSTLTRMPGKHRISGEQAMLFIGTIRQRLSFVSLNGDEYADALDASAAQGIVGGTIYDAMLAHVPLKPRRKRSMRGTNAAMRNADRRSLSAYARLKDRAPFVRMQERRALGVPKSLVVKMQSELQTGDTA